MQTYTIKIINLENQNISKITRNFANEQDLNDFVEMELAARKALTNCDYAIFF
jgi:hypothetical protein